MKNIFSLDVNIVIILYEYLSSHILNDYFQVSIWSKGLHSGIFIYTSHSALFSFDPFLMPSLYFLPTALSLSPRECCLLFSCHYVLSLPYLPGSHSFSWSLFYFHDTHAYTYANTFGHTYMFQIQEKHPESVFLNFMLLNSFQLHQFSWKFKKYCFSLYLKKISLCICATFSLSFHHLMGV